MTEHSAQARLAVLLATGLGAGRLPAPGTCGTLLTVPVALAMVHLPWLWQLATVTAVSLAAIWLCGIASRVLDKKDPGEIVLDEMAGFLLACFLLPRGWVWLGLAFVLFRFFDILKPWPIRALDRSLQGGWGIVADDLAAGAFSWLVVHICYRLSLLAGLQLP